MILGRPEITKEMGGKRFKEFFYTIEELIEFCKKNGLEQSGGKEELTERICAFIEGREPEPKFIIKTDFEDEEEKKITVNSIIEENVEFEEMHYDFFRKNIGAEFFLSGEFQDWLDANPGKTYGEAVDAWFDLSEEGFL